MSTERRAMIAKKACTRCSKSKKRCDRAMPDCGLCARFGRRCEYEAPKASRLDSTPSRSPGPEALLDSGPITPSRLKKIVVRNLELSATEDIVSAYQQAIEPWFPIVYKIQDRVLPTWDETPLDVTLLCLSILLLTTSPSSTAEDEFDPSNFKNLYLQTKSSFALAEALGLNNVPIAQSRIFLTLFEVGHGFYPAAYISIGATVRAVDALEAHPSGDALQPHCSSGAVIHEEKILLWCGVLILDRYIAAESGALPSLTRPRIEWLTDLLKPSLCPTHDPDHDKNSPLARFSRLVEASAMLDKIHTTIHSPTSEQIFNMEEVILTFKTATTLQTILSEEVLAEEHVYSGGLAVNQIALLLTFENGTKQSFLTSGSDNCGAFAITSLTYILGTITNTVEPFTTGTRAVDYANFPPFVTYLVFKAALITTQRLLSDLNANGEVANLRTLRKFLRVVGKRWLSCERYIKLLDEDTTPRMLKVIEQS